MSYEFYKILHLIGLVLLFTSLGALAVISMTASPAERRKPFMALHGTSTVIMLVACFGLLAKLGLARDIQMWVWAKIAIWLILGAAPVLLRRKPNLAFPVLLATIALGVVASYLAIMKPSF